MAAKIDLTGKQFNRLKVIEPAPKKGKKTRWLCKCDCGNTSIAVTSDLIHGKHRSCGCLHLESITKHGHTQYGGIRSLEYASWSSMKDRCLNINATFYHLYGGRGIKVCQRWADSFELFLADMGPRKSTKYTIERIDTNGDYEPSNCRWATRKEQAQNRRITDKMLASCRSRNRDKYGRYC